MGLVGEYFLKKKFPNIMELSYVHESPNIMGLSYVLSIMELSYERTIVWSISVYGAFLCTVGGAQWAGHLGGYIREYHSIV